MPHAHFLPGTHWAGDDIADVHLRAEHIQAIDTGFPFRTVTFGFL